MSANDLINFWEQTLNGHFEFQYFFVIYVTQKQSTIAGPWSPMKNFAEIKSKMADLRSILIFFAHYLGNLA